MTTPHQYTSLDCFTALSESANAIADGADSIRAQAAIVALAEVTAKWLGTAPPAHADAVFAEAAEIVQAIKAADAATGKA